MMKILVFGGSGLVGSRFIELQKISFDIDAPDTIKVNILEKDQIFKAAQTVKPQIVINFAAYTDVQGAEKEKDDQDGLCYKLNAEGPKNIADVCKKLGVKLVHISTDYVFDGQKNQSPYTEEDKPNPVNWYGQTKFYGEENVKNSSAHFIIVRISMPYVVHYSLKKDVARFFLDELRAGREVNTINDQKITPTLGDDIVKALVEISEAFIKATNKSNIYHVSVTNDTTPFEFATFLAKAFHLDTGLIKSISLDEYNSEKEAELLRYSRLDPAKFIGEFGENILHTVEENVKSYKQMVD